MKRFRIEWSRRAQRDLSGIHAYIAKDNPLAAQQVASTLIKHAESLTAFPNRGRPGLGKGTREILIPGWPWFILYRLDEDKVQIISVLHAAQDRMKEDDTPC